MKIDHHIFESLLHTKNISKKTFSHYAKIPYYTVAGWKKSGKVPAYAIVLLKSMPSAKTVTAKQLIDAGMPRAIFWNNDLTKAVQMIYSLSLPSNELIMTLSYKSSLSFLEKIRCLPLL